MNTSMKELNMNDMELASGGGSCLGAAVKKLVSMTGDWIADTAAPACKDAAKAARNITKAALRILQNWLD